MLPFFLLSPYLTSPDAQRVFERLCGPVLRVLFRVPGRAAGALLTGLVAGSPAGANACAAAGEGMTPGEYCRACFLCSGLSPAFLVTAVGSGYLGEQKWGFVLLLSHWSALLLGGLLLRGFEPHGEAARPAVHSGEQADLFVGALRNLGKVLCWMVVFGIVSALLCRRIGQYVPEWLIAPLCETAGGAQMLCQAPLPERERLVLLSFCTGFGGICVLCQCCSATGQGVGRMLAIKTQHGALSAGTTWLLLRWEAVPVMAIREDAFGNSALAAMALTLAVAIFCGAGGARRVDGTARGPYTKK